MLINWFTVFAQIINFLVLVFLLKRFLYRPIIRAMDKREESIASSLREAEQKKIEAEGEVESYRQKRRELNATREEMLAQAKEEVEARKRELTKRAREEVDELKVRWHEAVHEEKEAFLQELRKRVGKQIYEIAHRALNDLSDSEFEQRMIDVFLKRIIETDRGELNKMRESVKKSGKGVTISCAFEIPANTRREITRKIHDHIAEGVEVSYKVTPDLICGIELKANGYTLGWNLADYLKTLEEETRKVIEMD